MAIDYEEMKEIFNKRAGNGADYDAKKQEYFNEEYRKTGIYNDYDVRENANRDHGELMKKYKLATFNEGDSFEVGTKEVSKEKFSRIKNIVFAIVGAVAVGSALLIAADLVMHPEYYLTTHPEYIGPPGGFIESFSRMYEELSNLIGGIKR